MADSSLEKAWVMNPNWGTVTAADVFAIEEKEKTKETEEEKKKNKRRRRKAVRYPVPIFPKGG